MHGTVWSPGEKRIHGECGLSATPSKVSKELAKGGYARSRFAVAAWRQRHEAEWHSLCRRYSKTSSKETNLDEEAQEDLDLSEVDEANPEIFLDRDYYYNKDDDTYITWIKCAPKPIVLPGDVHQAMLRAYSRYDGNPATINEICRTFGMPRQYFNQYRMVHGWTHDHEPFTREEVETKTEQDLAEEAYQLRRLSLHKRLEQEKWADIRSDARKWRRLDAEVLRPLMEWIEKEAPDYSVPTLSVSHNDNKEVWIIPIADFHWGKYTSLDESQKKTNRELAKRRFRFLIRQVIQEASPRGTPQKIFLVFGGDWLHVDDREGNTTRGTRQDTDGVLFELVRGGCELQREAVDLLRQIAPVDVWRLPGNHDETQAFRDAQVLEAWYRNAEDVSVTVSARAREYTTYGKTLIGLTHGNNVKLDDLPTLMATEKPREWGSCPHRLFFTEHFHTLKTVEGRTSIYGSRGVLLCQGWTMTGDDRWHTQRGFTGSVRGVALHVVDETRGLVSQVLAPVESINEDE